MAKLIASYFINSIDRNVDLVLDSAIWEALSYYNGECADSGVWYLDTDETVKSICARLENIFESKKVELMKTGVKESIIEDSKLSLCIHEFSGNNWISYHDEDAEKWFKKRGIEECGNVITGQIREQMTA